MNVANKVFNWSYLNILELKIISVIHLEPQWNISAKLHAFSYGHSRWNLDCTKVNGKFAIHLGGAAISC